MRKMLGRCPVCGGELVVKRLVCHHCGTSIEGTFYLNEFAALPPEHLEFLRTYLKNRGNLSKVAEVMGVSYPTAHSRFNQLLRALGYGVEEETASERAKIIEMLEKGEISPKEAVKRLKELGKGGV